MLNQKGVVMENEAAMQNDDAQTTEDQAQATPHRVLSDVERVALLEALLLANGDPLSIQRIQDVVGLSRSEVLESADRLQAALADNARGIELVVVAEKLQLRTKAAYADYVRQLMAVKPRKLSQAALETLAVVAYQQPVVKSEIDKIRGVDVAPTLKTLLERKLVKIIGYQASVGQPALYGTTEDFLQVFGLSALSELPALQDLKALVKEPGEAQAASADDGQADEDQDEAQPEVPYQDQPEGSQVSQ
jgi:segregation and condensation protein B